MVEKFKSQRNDPTTNLDGLNCTCASCAMAMFRASGGAVDVFPGQVRDATNDTEGGTNLDQVIDAAASWDVELENRTGGSWEDFLDDVEEGRGAILQGDYDQLLLCSSVFKDPHAIYVVSIDREAGTAVVGDPLCQAFKSVLLSVLRRYAEKLGEAQMPSEPQAIFYAVTPVTTEAALLNPKIVKPVALATVAPGGTLYANPAKTSVLVASWVGGTNIGVYGQTANGLTAIRYDTLSGPAENLVDAYVGTDKVTIQTPDTAAVALAGRRQEWDRQDSLAVVTLAPRP